MIAVNSAHRYAPIYMQGVVIDMEWSKSSPELVSNPALGVRKLPKEVEEQDGVYSAH